MFKIGDFSRLSQVSIKALRHYDEIALLEPAHIDSSTGYRYYTAEQLGYLNKILVLKNLGFSLEQVALMIDTGLTVGNLREMLLKRRTQIQNQLNEEQERLAQVEARLRQIEEEGDKAMSGYDIVIKKIEPLSVYAVRETIANYWAIGDLFGRICGAVASSGGKFSGPCLTVYYDEGYKENDVDVEVAVQVSGTSGLEIKTLPGIEKAACAIHHGPYEGFMDAYQAMAQWIEQQGYKMVGPCREFYLRSIGEVDDPADCVTEIQIPVEKI
ncbi:MAG TPA: MerR family transcriptional regulator [Syntrophomonadaceae bacterium]|nr:MerR family transcriptional regulator [Syntrophomonadaceae bacterium]